MFPGGDSGMPRQPPRREGSAVVGIKDTDGLAKTKAFIVLNDPRGFRQTSDELKEYCKKKMAPYKAPDSSSF